MSIHVPLLDSQLLNTLVLFFLLILKVMRKLLFALILISLVAFRSMNDNNLAEVNQVQGYYIFVDSKPVKEYEYLGTVKVTAWNVSSEQYQGVRDGLIKKARKEYPKGDGIIFNFSASGSDQADVVKFKE